MHKINCGKVLGSTRYVYHFAMADVRDYAIAAMMVWIGILPALYTALQMGHLLADGRRICGSTDGSTDGADILTNGSHWQMYSNI